MASARRKISKQERKERDALMRVIEWASVLAVKRLFDDREVTAVLLPVFRETLPESVADAAIRGVLARIGELRAGGQ